MNKVIEVIESEFTYKGVTYKADAVYLNMAKEYLANDIDATYEQSQKAIQYIYDNIEQGESYGDTNTNRNSYTYFIIC